MKLLISKCDRVIRSADKALRLSREWYHQYTAKRLVDGLPKDRVYDPIELPHDISFNPTESK